MDHLRAGLEHPSPPLRRDQVDVALPIADLLAREAVALLAKRPQALAQNPDRARVDRELALVCPEHRAFHGEDVAEVPVLELLVAWNVLGNVGLDTPAAVLQRREARLAHDALQQHAPGNAGRRLQRLELLLLFFAEPSVEIGREVLAPEVVREGVAFRAQRLQLLAPFFGELEGAARER